MMILLLIAQLMKRKIILVYLNQLFDSNQLHNAFRNHVKVVELAVLFVIKLVQESLDHISI